MVDNDHVYLSDDNNVIDDQSRIEHPLDHAPPHAVLAVGSELTWTRRYGRISASAPSMVPSARCALKGLEKVPIK